MSTVYIAGPMRHHEEFNFPAFDGAAKRLRAEGWTVYSPAEHDRSIGFDEHGTDPSPEQLAQMMRWDMATIAISDAIYLLPGWETSEGARRELDVARACGLIVMEAPTLPDGEHRYWNGQAWTEPPAEPGADAAPPPLPDPAIRHFETGASRDGDAEKWDPEGFLSPRVLRAFCAYMHRNRTMADGSLRASDNWQRGIPLDVYMKSLLRHVMDLWALHRGVPAVRPETGQPATVDEALGGLLFNAMGYWHEASR